MHTLRNQGFDEQENISYSKNWVHLPLQSIKPTTTSDAHLHANANLGFLVSPKDRLQSREVEKSFASCTIRLRNALLAPHPTRKCRTCDVHNGSAQMYSQSTHKALTERLLNTIMFKQNVCMTYKLHPPEPYVRLYCTYDQSPQLCSLSKTSMATTDNCLAKINKTPV